MPSSAKTVSASDSELAEAVLESGVDSSGEADISRVVTNLIGHLTETRPRQQEPPFSEIDIWLESCNLVVETKKPGRAKDPHKSGTGSGVNLEGNPKSAFEQIEGYADQVLKHQAGRPRVGEKPRPVVGIITDGSNWHGWSWAHVGAPANEFRKSEVFRPGGKRQLSFLAWLYPFLQGRGSALPVPDNPYEVLFEPRLADLFSIDTRLSGRNAAKSKETQYLLWADMFRGSGMSPDTTGQDPRRLFTYHTFLVCVSRAVISALSGDDPSPDKALAHGFVSWILAWPDGKRWAESLFDLAHGFDWTKKPRDVLRATYESVIDAHSRHTFGEHYTPDWMAEMIVERVCDNEWADEAIECAEDDDNAVGHGVLDPTCGSGTFLYHAARCLVARAGDKYTPQQIADRVARLVHGIDIHPVAVEIAKATLLRALPAVPSAGTGALRIYQGDALGLDFDDRQDGDKLIRLDQDAASFVTPRQTEFRIPWEFINQDNLHQRLVQFVDAALLGKPTPNHLKRGLSNSARRLILEAGDKLQRIIEEEGNGVWAWYIFNNVSSEVLRKKKVARIVANPPWVRMSSIQVKDRKDRMKRIAEREGLWPSGKSATGFDIAALFIKCCEDRYLGLARDQAEVSAGWILPAASLRGDNWSGWRATTKSKLAEAIDTSSVNRQPFSGAKCSVWYTGGAVRSPGGRVELVNTGPKLVRRDVGGWGEASKLLKTRLPERFSVKPSGYYNYAKSQVPFRQGATITPKLLVVIDESQSIANGRVEFKTAKSKHSPWKTLDPLTGDLPGNWLVDLIGPNDWSPYFIAKTSTCIVPPNLESMIKGKANPTEPFWTIADRLYRDYRGKGASTPATLARQIDYSGKLSSQLGLSDSCRVIYNTSGSNLRAARISGSKAVCDSSSYWWCAGSEAEAGYLVSILNSESLSDRFRATRRSDRHFHTYFWSEVPIPRYDPQNPDHIGLARLCGQAESIVDQLSLTIANQNKRSNTIRRALKSIPVRHPAKLPVIAKGRTISEAIDKLAVRVVD